MLMRHPHPVFQFTHTLPYGAVIHDGGVQFVVYQPFGHGHASVAVRQRQMTANRRTWFPSIAIPIAWGTSGACTCRALARASCTIFRPMDRAIRNVGCWFDGRARLIDPYAKALAGCFQQSDDGVIRPPKCVVVDDYFDWEGDRHLRRDLSETIIYEMHVRGFTQSSTSLACGTPARTWG